MVEKRINNKLREFLQKFKDDIKNHIINDSLCENDEEMKNLLQYIYDYQPLKLTKIDFQKRKRIKNVVPLYNRCCAYRANHEQCTRRKKKSLDFCSWSNCIVHYKRIMGFSILFVKRVGAKKNHALPQNDIFY